MPISDMYLMKNSYMHQSKVLGLGLCFKYNATFRTPVHSLTALSLHIVPVALSRTTVFDEV